MGKQREASTFFTCLFHFSFATCTLTVLLESPAERTIPFISLASPPDAVLVTAFAPGATERVTAVADIAGCRLPVLTRWCCIYSPRATCLLRDSFDRTTLQLWSGLLARRLACRDVVWTWPRLHLKFNGLAPARHRRRP